MVPVSVLNPNGSAPLVLTCEHASWAVPAEYDDLGLQPEQLQEHIGWDIGVHGLAEALAERCDATAILAGVSRLIIDCNRDLSDHDLIVAESDGVVIPGNSRIDDEERARRVRDFYDPYHQAVDEVLKQRAEPLLLSLHSFTPVFKGSERRFDVGVLFDTCAALARQLAQALAQQGLRVRHNEPYSGLDGLIFSARKHGLKHGLCYLELEINNALLRTSPVIKKIAAIVAPSLSAQIESLAHSR